VTTFHEFWGATYGTCQVITGYGLSPTFEVQTGVRQGEKASPTKFNAWMDILWCFLDKERVVGALVNPTDSTGPRIAFLGFADDIWLASDSFEELQRTLHLVDHFLEAYGVELNPSKSMYAHIGGAPDDQCVGLWRFVEGQRVWVPLQKIPPNGHFRYLGILIQPNGAWHAMTAHVMAKVRTWAAQVAQAQLPLDQAVMVLRSVVGGLLQYVLCAAPLSLRCMQRFDKLVAAALYKCAGVAKGRSTLWAFLPEGFGALSAVVLRRAVVLERVLTLLNA
jgi:hypothetical protein